MSEYVANPILHASNSTDKHLIQEGKSPLKRRGSSSGDAKAKKAKEVEEGEDGNGYTPAKA